MMNEDTSKSGCGPTVPMAPRAVRKCVTALGGGGRGGAPARAMVLLVARSPAKGLDGLGDGEALDGALV